MEVKVKKKNKDGIVKLETKGEVKEVLINEDFLNPGDESISVCFRGKDSSGIINLKPREIEKLHNTVRKKTHLIRDFKIIKEK